MEAKAERLLFVVEEASNIRGKGILLIPGVVASIGASLTKGTDLVLELPSGKRYLAKVDAVALTNATKYLNGRTNFYVPILVKTDLKSSVIEPGTKVYGLDH